MRARWALLFKTPLPEAVDRLERLAQREILHLRGLDEPRASRHAVLILEVIEEARFLRAYVEGKKPEPQALMPPTVEPGA